MLIIIVLFLLLKDPLKCALLLTIRGIQPLPALLLLLPLAFQGSEGPCLLPRWTAQIPSSCRAPRDQPPLAPRFLMSRSPIIVIRIPSYKLFAHFYPTVPPPDQFSFSDPGTCIDMNCNGLYPLTLALISESRVLSLWTHHS